MIKRLRYYEEIVDKQIEISCLSMDEPSEERDIHSLIGETFEGEDTVYGKEALADRALYDAIVEHRRTYYALKYVNYDLHNPSTINFMIPDQERDAWVQDYADMQRFFIYGRSLEFDVLMKRIEELQEQIHLI